MLIEGEERVKEIYKKLSITEKRIVGDNKNKYFRA
jgi:hypothetical protein